MSNTHRAPANSKWSINIKEIVKRTQRNFDQGTKPPASLTRTLEEPKVVSSSPALREDHQKLTTTTTAHKETSKYLE